MKRSGVVRRALSISAVALLAALTACGGGGSAGSSASPAESRSASAPADESPSDETPPGGSVAEPGASADAKCGSGSYETKVVEAAQDVQLTVPVDWEVESFRAGFQNRLYPPDRDVGDGYLVVQPWVRSLDEAADDALRSTRAAAETTSEQDLELPGFDGARMFTFAYDDETFAVDVVAVYKGFRLLANMTREGVPKEQAVAESCFSSLSRSS